MIDDAYNVTRVNKRRLSVQLLGSVSVNCKYQTVNAMGNFAVRRDSESLLGNLISA